MDLAFNYPFTAPTVNPVMRCLNIMKQKMVTCSIDTIPAALLSLAADLSDLHTSDVDTLETSVWVLALYGGEEYNLIFTFKRRDLAKVSEALDGAYFNIGRVTNRRERIELKTEGRVESIKPRGWEHFKHN